VGAEVSNLQDRPPAVTENAANLNAQLSELNRLREEVRKALLLARKSPQTEAAEWARRHLAVLIGNRFGHTIRGDGTLVTFGWVALNLI